MSRPQGHSATGRIRSSEKYRDLIGNRKGEKQKLQSQRFLFEIRHTRKFDYQVMVTTNHKTIIFFIARGVGLSPLHCGHFWPMAPAPDDRWVIVEQLVEWRLAGETCPSATLSTTNPNWPDPGSNPGRRGGRPATNRLSYGGNHKTILFIDITLRESNPNFAQLLFLHSPFSPPSYRWIHTLFNYFLSAARWGHSRRLLCTASEITKNHRRL
jgi:hypothetical protein